MWTPGARRRFRRVQDADGSAISQPTSAPATPVGDAQRFLAGRGSHVPGGEVIRAAGLSLEARREHHRGGLSLVTARQRRAVNWLRIPFVKRAANNVETFHRESPLRWPQSLGVIRAELSPQNQFASVGPRLTGAGATPRVASERPGRIVAPWGSAAERITARR